MDIAYDHIQEEVLSPDEMAKKEAEDSKRKQPTLNNEFQEAYKSFSASPWGAKLGGFFSDVKKQGESYYKEAQQEASAAGGEALKGFTDLRTTLVNRARSMSSTQQEQPSDDPQKEALDQLSQPPVTESAKEKERERTESEALRESEGLIARFRIEASKRLKEVQKAEDAADEALLKFGTNVRNFLRDAVTIAPPSEEDEKGKRKDGSSKVLFESKDQDGQRVIHTTRFDAQLHAIHSSSNSFAKDPESVEYEKWQKDFDVEKQTDAIAVDLEKYEGLRKAMEKLVPEKVEYKTFWSRYYFLRMVIETEEQRRREMLKGSSPSSPPPSNRLQLNLCQAPPSILKSPYLGTTIATATPHPHRNPQLPLMLPNPQTPSRQPLIPRQLPFNHPPLLPLPRLPDPSRNLVIRCDRRMAHAVLKISIVNPTAMRATIL